MVWKFGSRLIRKLTDRVSLRTLLTVPFIVQLGIVTTLIGGLSFYSGREAVDTLVKRLGRETSDRLAQTLETELAQPHAVYQTIQGAIDTDQIDINDFQQLQCYFQRLVNQDNGVDYLLFGRPTGEVLAVQKLENGEMVVKVREGSIPERQTYRLNENCDRGELLGSKSYDARDRPWYQTAVRERQPTWGPISISASASLLTGDYFLYATPVTPVARPTGEILGVLGAEIPLTEIKRLLNKLKISESGLAFIVDGSGELVGASTGDLPYIINSEKVNRFPVSQSSNLLIREAANYLLNRFESWDNLYSRKQLLFKIDGQTHLLHTTPLNNNQGLDWIVIVIIPVADFMGPIYTNLRYTLILCLVALLIAIILGIATASRIIYPIQELNQSAQLLSQGNWNQKVTLRRFDELRTLAESFNSMAEQIKVSFSRLESKNQELERLDRLKDEFLANTSYELRTPLNGMIGLAESLLERSETELSTPTKFNLSLIVSSGQRLVNLVNNVLDLSRLKHEELELNCKGVELRAIAEVTLTQCHPLIGHKDLSLTNEITSDLPLVYGDENRIQQILYQLVDNGIKFTESGLIKITAILENIFLKITVSDTGIGITEDAISQIFQPLESEEEANTKIYGGIGLGLPLTKRLIELHGGEFWVESTLGLGSSFIFTLPILSDSGIQSSRMIREKRDILKEHTHLNNIPLQNNPQLIPSKTLTHQLTILVVDDEIINLQTYSTYLRIGEYSIIEAQSGEEVFRLLEEGLKPDLIVLDIMMPRMTGYEVTRQIRQTKSPTELPIILLSTKNQVADLVMGLELGANDYLTKPVSKDELLARIKMHLNLQSLKVENLRLATEVEITSRLQTMLLPKPSELRKIEDLEVVGFMESADEVGGDYYDIFYQDKRLIIGIGDVTGHGLESGVLAIMLQTAIRCLIYSEYQEIKDFFQILNRTLWENIQRMDSDKHLTLSIVEYEQGILKISGQHESVILVRSGGEIQCIETLDLGFPIGLDIHVMQFFSQVKFKLNPGDIVVLYTDGITEAENSDREHYGIERLCAAIRGDRDRSAEEIKTTIIEDVKRHIGTQKVYDDITLVVLKRNV